MTSETELVSAHEPAYLLADEAVFRRTRKGQRELLSQSGLLDGLERRFLSVVTGHTSLRVLLDLGLQTSGMSDAILRLVGQGLIELVERPG